MKNSKKINYFDLGTYQGETISMFLQLIDRINENKDEKIDVRVYGIEANTLYSSYCQRRFANDKRVSIFHFAISDKHGYVPLYFSKNSVGDSIFKPPRASIEDATKNKDVTILGFLSEYYDLTIKSLLLKGYIPMENYKTLLDFSEEVKLRRICDPTEYEIVPSDLFSNWVAKELLDFETSINIMKINIEGAEYVLFKDLEEANILKHFDIFCGKGEDVYKKTELSNIFEEHTTRLKNNKIEIHRFSDWKPERNANLKKMIEGLS